MFEPETSNIALSMRRAASRMESVCDLSFGSSVLIKARMSSMIEGSPSEERSLDICFTWPDQY